MRHGSLRKATEEKTGELTDRGKTIIAILPDTGERYMSTALADELTR